MSQPLRIIFAGSGAFGLPTLRAIQASGHQIVQVISQPDRPAGRGRKLTPTPIAEYAISQALSLIRTENINAEPQLADADILVVIAFGQKLSESVIDGPRLGSINLHASRLPKFRGAAPIQAAIMAGEQITGNSVIRLAQRMDAGAVLGQSDIEIGPSVTAGELHDRLAEDGAPLMLSVLQSLSNGTAVETVQDPSAATVAPKLSRETSRIDWSRPGEQIARQIRGLFPWPGCRVRLIDADQGGEVSRMTLARTIVSSNRNQTKSPQPGEITDALTLMTGDGTSLEVIELQPEGKRPMSLAAYRNGHRWEPGIRVESITTGR